MKRVINSAILFAMLIVCGSYASAQVAMNTVVSVTGNVLNQVSHIPCGVTITVYDSKGAKLNKVKSNSADGYYLVTGLKPGGTYKFAISGNGYFNDEIAIVIPQTDKYLEISKDILTLPLYDNVKLPCTVSPFELNKSKIRFGADAYLKEFALPLTLNKNVRIQILCYPDNNTDKEANIQLTKARAEALKDFFVNSGVSADRITISGSETTDPKNPPPAGKAAKGKRYIGTSFLVVTGF